MTRYLRWRLALTAGLVLITAGVAPAVASPAGAAPAAPARQAAPAAPPPLPDSMVSTGDSITRAFDVGFCCVFADAPQYSWSTGSASSVPSHYRRILAGNPAIGGRAANLARTGAKMVDLDRQLRLAAAARPEYVTVLIGANDVCTPTRAQMTPTATFQAQFAAALTRFTAAAPSARVLVASIPDVYRLWSVLHRNFAAVATWELFGICQSMLDVANREADRRAVSARERAFNAALARVCARFAQCRWDSYATFGVAFDAVDVSPVDYFHPSLRGQSRLAATSWQAGYWAGS